MDTVNRAVLERRTFWQDHVISCLRTSLRVSYSADNRALTLVKHFSKLDDPGCPGKVDHQLIDILVIAVCTVIRSQRWSG